MTMRFWLLLPVLALAACATTPQPAPAPAPPAPPPPGLGRLIGLDVAGVTKLLGSPALDRAEGQARAMQYIRPVCASHVYLYPPAAGGPPKVRTAAARKPDGSRIDPGACLSLMAPAP